MYKTETRIESIENAHQQIKYNKGVELLELCSLVHDSTC